MRKVIVRWRDVNSEVNEPFLEGERGSFPVGHPDPATWCRTCVENFNATLRPSESRREILDITVDSGVRENDVKVQHQWTKTNLVTVSNGRNTLHDTARCTECGITGKRFGLTDIRRDRQYKADGYATCNGAKRLLKRRKARTESR